MKNAEKTVKRLEKRRTTLSADLSSMDGTDHQQLAATGSDLAAVEAELAATEEQWLALAEEADI